MRTLFLTLLFGVTLACLIPGVSRGGVIGVLPRPAGSLQTSKQAKVRWRAATPAELGAALPARAQVERERIETEQRTASGITDGHDHIIAAIVLITAGYAANGKYSHYLLVQSPITLSDTLRLAPGSYVLGWTRNEEGLLVHCFEALTGIERGTVTARIPTPPLRVEPFRIHPPGEGAFIQIGRFALPYRLE